MQPVIQCTLCQNYIEAKMCKAFLDGIPEQIWSGHYDHMLPYDGDNGIRFEAKEKDADAYG